MAASKEQSGKEADYSDEDQKLIISLLNEYSAKLLHICEQIDEHEISKDLFFSSLLLFVVSIPGLGALLIQVPFSFSSNSPVLTYTYLSMLITITLFAIYKRMNSIIRKAKSLRRDSEILSIKLEKVVRIGSQAHEHVVSNFVSRVELDLRLTDAESALQRYTSQLSQSKKQ
jgi:hypothetical protein